MHITFDEKKTTQVAAILMKMHGKAGLLSGKNMHYIKLLKLLYLIDREALLKWGRPVTFDKYVSMNKGPVLSRTLNLITDELMPGEKSYWLEYISFPKKFVISLKKDPGQEELSVAEIDVIKEIYERYGKMSRWDLIKKVMHELPEWVDPNGSAIPIEYEDILKAAKKTPQETASILEELEHLQTSKNILVSD